MSTPKRQPVEERKAGLNVFSTKQLRELLKERKISYADCLDKQDLINKVLASDEAHDVDQNYYYIPQPSEIKEKEKENKQTSPPQSKPLKLFETEPKKTLLNTTDGMEFYINLMCLLNKAVDLWKASRDGQRAPKWHTTDMQKNPMLVRFKVLERLFCDYKTHVDPLLSIRPGDRQALARHPCLAALLGRQVTSKDIQVWKSWENHIADTFW